MSWQLNNKKERTELDLEKVAKIVPLIIGFFIGCGSLYLETYYKCFHINIFNYLDTTEILTTFLYLIQDIAFITAILIGYVLVIKLGIWIMDFSRKQPDKTNDPIKSSVQLNIFQKFGQVSSTLILAGALIFCVIYLLRSYSIEYDSKYIVKNRIWMSAGLLVFSFISSFWLTAQFELQTKQSLRNLTVFTALFFISYSVSEAVVKIERTVNREDLNSMVIVGSDTIQSNAKYIYVGRTNKYVFFYDTYKERTDIIPQGEISKMSFSSQKP
jgi:hypothetical protein